MLSRVEDLVSQGQCMNVKLDQRNVHTVSTGDDDGFDVTP